MMRSAKHDAKPVEHDANPASLEGFHEVALFVRLIKHLSLSILISGCVQDSAICIRPVTLLHHDL